MSRGRPRKPENRALPAYVYLSKGRYVWREYHDGRIVREVVLAPASASMSTIWEKYEQIAEGPKNTFRWLAELYLKSSQYQEKSPKTRKDYAYYHENVINAPVKGGKFGDVSLAKITPGVVRKYLDKRSDKSGPVLANREVAYMSVVFSWGYERDLVKQNPCKGVRRNTEKERTRYVEDWEYSYVYAKAPNNVKAAMEIMYLCRLRKIEVLSLTRRDMKPEGLLCKRTKGSKTQMVPWSDRLRAAVNLALSENTKAVTQTEYILRGRDGNKVRSSSFDTAWQRLIAKCMWSEKTQEGLKESFTPHDLKAKGVSDFEGDKRKASGHKDPRMTERYDRKLEEVPPTR